MIGVVKANRTGTVADGVIYCAFYGFFVFVRAEKTKKRGSEGAGARDGGRSGEDRRRDAGGRAGGVPAVFLASVGVF